MGETKRRQKRVTQHVTAPETIPDCLFIRDRAAEESGGFVLAGVIINRRPILSHEDAKQVFDRFVAVLPKDPAFKYVLFNVDGSSVDCADKLQERDWLIRHYLMQAEKYQQVTIRLRPFPDTAKPPLREDEILAWLTKINDDYSAMAQGCTLEDAFAYLANEVISKKNVVPESAFKVAMSIAENWLDVFTKHGVPHSVQ